MGPLHDKVRGEGRLREECAEEALSESQCVRALSPFRQADNPEVFAPVTVLGVLGPRLQVFQSHLDGMQGSSVISHQVFSVAPLRPRLPAGGSFHNPSS